LRGAEKAEEGTKAKKQKEFEPLLGGNSARRLIRQEENSNLTRVSQEEILKIGRRGQLGKSEKKIPPLQDSGKKE